MFLGWGRVSKLVEGGLYVVGDGSVDGTVGIDPFEVDATV